MQVVSAYRIASDNIGDAVSCPALYFPVLAGERSDIGRESADVRGKLLVLGGGGVLGPFSDKALGYSRAGASKTVAWGIGTNESRTTNPIYGPIRDYDLVGCRDWGVPFEWVPCVSCLSSLFDEAMVIRPVCQFVVFQHSGSNLGSGKTAMSNSHMDFAEVLRFLASGEAVVTDSYHGAYWATLLGRKVVIVEPWSTKFLFMRHRPVMASRDDIPRAINRAILYPEALAECRAANLAFAQKVQGLIAEATK